MASISNILRIKSICLFIFITIFLSGCQGTSNPLNDFNLFPVSKDIELGRQLDSAIRSNPKDYPLLNSYQSDQYLQNIINTIISSQFIEYKSIFAYKVEIIRQDSIVNAFATPGGYIYVYTGLLKFVDNEATLAGVLAHEIAHAERRHATQSMTKAYGAQILLNLLLGNSTSQIEDIAANLLSGLALLKNSRDDEAEADDYSFKYLNSINYWYPGGIKYFFQKINDNSSASFLDELLSTHPMTQSRLDAINKLLTDNNIPSPSESNIFTQRYQDFKKTLP